MVWRRLLMMLWRLTAGVRWSASVVAWQDGRLQQLMDVLVKKFVHNSGQSVGILLVGHQQGQGEVTSLSPGSLTQQRMISLAHVGLQTNGSTRGLKSQ